MGKVIELIESEVILENDLKKAAEVYIFEEDCAELSHLACAIYAGCEYLLTTDIRFQKRYKGNEIRILNPLEFVNLVEEEEI